MRSKMSAIGTSDSAFHDGNPSTGELGTIVTADWLNAVQASTMDLQDELLNVLAAASIANDPAVKTQILAAINKLSKLNMQSGSATFATDTGAANAYVVSLTPALAAPRGEGQVIRFKVANTNTGACTVNDGVSTVPIVGLTLSALQGGEMTAGGDAWIQWHPYVGTGSYVLLFCSGAAVQVGKALKSNHAVQLSQLGSYNSIYALGTTQTLTSNMAGSLIGVTGVGISLTLPLRSLLLDGAAFTFVSTSASGSSTILPPSGDGFVFCNGTTKSSITIGVGDSISIVKFGSTWVVFSGSLQLGSSASFGALKSTNGYQKLPSGLIIQWVTGQTSSTGRFTGSWPIVFPTALLCEIPMCVGGGATSTGNAVAATSGGAASASVFDVWAASSLSGQGAAVFAIGC